MGGSKGWRGTGAQQLANWRAAGVGGWAPGQCAPGPPGAGKAQRIVIELVEVRTPLNEEKKERGNEGLGTMQPERGPIHCP